jgi:hexosaminidase
LFVGKETTTFFPKKGMSRFHKIFSLIAIATLVSCSGNKNPITDLTSEALIPIPLEVTATNAAFFIDEDMVIQVDESSSDLIDIGGYLSENIESHSGISLSVQSNQDSVSGIRLVINDIESENPEAYELNI